MSIFNIAAIFYSNSDFVTPLHKTLLSLCLKISNVVVSLQDPASPNPRLSLCLISSPYPSTTTWPCHMGLFFWLLGHANVLSPGILYLLGLFTLVFQAAPSCPGD